MTPTRVASALLSLVAIACADDDSFHFQGDPFSELVVATVASARTDADRAVLVLEAERRDAMTFEWRVEGGDRPALPVPGDDVVVEGSVSEFEELPEVTYWRVQREDGRFVLEGGLAVDNGDSFTGDDIDGMFTVIDVLAASRVRVANDGADVELAAGESAEVVLNGARRRAVIVQARTDLLRAYAYGLE